MGINLRKVGKYEESLDKLRSAAELNLNRSNLFNNIGLTNVELGEFGEACSWFAKAIAVDGHIPAYWNNRGLAWYNVPNHKNSIHDFKEAKRLNLQ